MDNWEETHFNHFWARMLGIYGKRWNDDHGLTINPSWRDVLKTMSFEKVAKTIEICLNSNDAHPITLSQFIHRAKSISIKAQQDFESLPAPKITPEQRQINLERFGRMISNTLVKPKSRLRSILLPGEGLDDIQRALGKCRTEKDRALCIIDRLAKNGWTMADEKLYAVSAHTVGYKLCGDILNPDLTEFYP